MARLGTARRAAFLDTSAYYALTDSEDENHATARAIAQELRDQRWQLIPTNFIIAEAHALLLRWLGQRAAATALMDIRHGSINIVRVAPEHEDRAEQIILRYTDKEFSFTDALSFAVMEDYGIRYAFSFDRDFTRYGLTTLTLDLLK